MEQQNQGVNPLMFMLRQVHENIREIKRYIHLFYVLAIISLSCLFAGAIVAICILCS